MATKVQTAQGLGLAIFGAAAGAYLNYLESKAGDASALATELAGYYKNEMKKDLTVAQVLSNMNLKSGTTAYSAAKAILDVNVTAGDTPAQAAAGLVTYLDMLTDSTSDLFATATAFKARIEVAVTWSKGAGATEKAVTALVAYQAQIDNPAPVVPEEPVVTTTALTAAADNLTGTVGADAFTGVRSTSSTLGTLGATDKIDGGEGTDSLTVTMTSDFTGFSTGSVKNVEVISIKNEGDVARSFDATGVVGAATYNLEGRLSLANADTLGTVNVVNRSSGTTTVDFADTKVSTTTDNVLTLGVTKLGAGTTHVTVTAPDIQKMTVNASGDASNVDLAGAPLKSVTITGSSDLSLRATSVTTLTTIDGSAATGKLTLSNLAGTVTSIKTGSADDAVTVSAMSTAAVLSGGAGNDKLTLSALAAETYQPTMTGFESLAITGSGGAVTLSLSKSTDLANLSVNSLGGALTMVKSGAGALNISAKGAQSANTISTDSSGAVSFATTAADTLTTITNDANALSVTASKASSLSIDVAKFTNTTGAFSAGEAKSLTLNANGGFVGAITAAKATDLTITAAETVTLTGSTLSAVNNLTATTSKSLTTAGLTAPGTLTLAGTGSSSKMTTGDLGAAANTQAIALTATGWKGGVAIGAVDGQDGINLDLSATTGTNTIGVIGGLGVATTAPTGSVTVNSTGSLGSLTLTDADVSSGKSITITAKDAVSAVSIADGQTLSVATSSSNPSGTITVDVSGGIATTVIGGLKAGTVNVNVSNMLKAATVGTIDSLTLSYTGDEVVANSITGKANKVTFVGGDGVDTLAITQQDSLATVAGVTATTANAEINALNISTGANNDVVGFTMYAGQLQATYTGTVNLGENSGDADTLTFNAVSGATLLDLQGVTVTGADDGGVAVDGSTATGGITIYGTTNSDKIVGSSGLDVIFAGTGDDLITVAATTDIVTNEVLNGGLGTDTLYLSSAGTYNLTSLASTADNLVGEAGIENLIVKHTAITLDEAISGSALRVNTDGAVTLVMTISMTGTTLDLSKTTFTALAAATSPATETALTAADDGFSITGSAAADTITLSSLGDTVVGGIGADTIVGGTGDDVITGGAGADSITAGTGADVINFASTTAALQKADAGDVIVGFVSGTDSIVFELDAFVDPAGATPSTVAAEQIVTNMATNANISANTLAFIYQLTGTTDSATANTTTGAAAALANIDGADDTTAQIIFLLDNGTNSYIWLWDADSGAAADTTVNADELTLMGTINGVTALAANDIIGS